MGLQGGASAGLAGGATAGRALDGLVALVTGAAQGIGLAVARALADAGAVLAIVDLHETAEAAMAALPGGTVYLRCDVTKPDEVEAATKSVVERLGGLHLLVNNAGIAIDGLVLRQGPADWSRVIEVNLTGTFNFIKAAGRFLLRARDKGRIVNIASVVGEQGNVGQAAYAASKAGLLGLTRTVALEFAGRGITVNAVSPGFIQTAMTEEHVKGERRERILQAIPLGRIGLPKDVAAAVAFLCSPQAGYITGQVLRVNGGLYM
jgi:3-oxoacyl-[acyl-carrier protein] reductase